MIKLWKLTQNLLRKQNNFLQYKKLNSLRPIIPNIRKLFGKSKLPKIFFFHFTIGSPLIPPAKITVEDDLFKAFTEGEASIINLMNELKNLVITASKEYRSCLTQQIDFIKRTGDVASEELPKYRTKASELSSELNEYVIILKTIGEIAYDQTVIGIMLQKNSLETIMKKYKELEILLLHEFEENKKKELELLEVNIANMGSKN